MDHNLYLDNSNVFIEGQRVYAARQGGGNRRWTNVIEAAFGQHAIPNREVVDKILRYEAMTERSLNRALDRLERLQRRREGEAIPPALRVHLT